jgi:putative transposase
MSSTRNRTSSPYIGRALYLYFLGLSTRNVAKAMFCFRKVKRSHVLLAKKWKWIQKYHPRKILTRSKRIFEFIVDETLLKVGSEYNGYGLQ